ncbi:MAG: hypothetical protein FJ034_07435, partial [Chloroflexi bacterium]|nr:hypothetical protein [Chloroflexota bacterium]
MLPIVAPPRADGRRDLYFSACDGQGRTRPGRTRFDLARPGWSGLEAEPLLDLGPRGAFDDNGVTASSIVRHRGRTFLYYIGWSLGVTVPFYVSIGCAVSRDGGAMFRRAS